MQARGRRQTGFKRGVHDAGPIHQKPARAGMGERRNQLLRTGARPAREHFLEMMRGQVSGVRHLGEIWVFTPVLTEKGQSRRDAWVIHGTLGHKFGGGGRYLGHVAKLTRLSRERHPVLAPGPF